MAFQFPPTQQPEILPIYKILFKAMPYLFAAADDPGERHEIYVLLRAQRGSLEEVGGAALYIESPGHFSRSLTTMAQFPDGSPMRTFLDYFPTLGQDSKVIANGQNEVDFVFHYETGGLRRRVVVEAKSGDADSSASQINSYLEALLDEKIADPNNERPPHEFYHCYEGFDVDVDSKVILKMHRVFRAMTVMRSGDSGKYMPFTNAVLGLDPRSQIRTENKPEEKMRALLTAIKSAAPGADAGAAAREVAILSSAALAKELNERFFVPILGFKVGVIKANKVARKDVRDGVLRMMVNNRMISDGGDELRRQLGEVYTALEKAAV